MKHLVLALLCAGTLFAGNPEKMDADAQAELNLKLA